MLLTTIVSPANAALTTTTANTIEGSKPYLTYLDTDGTTVKLTSVDELLGFTVPDQSSLSGRVQITTSTSTIVAPSGMSFNDVVPLVTADGASHNILSTSVGDDDGDAANAANTSASGNMTATWYTKSISDANKITTLNQSLSMCGSPYYLVISATGVGAETTHGAPRTNTYTNSDKTYEFTTTSRGVCNLKPGDMTVYTTSGAAGVNSMFPSTGYNPATWESGKGFKVHAGFPTTGFNKAVFTLVMSGNQSDYTFSSDNPVASIDASGVVTLNSTTKPSLPLTVKLTATTNTAPPVIIPYSFKIDKWARVLGNYNYKTDDNPRTNGIFPAASMCKYGSTTGVSTSTEAKQYFFSAVEWTNAPNVYQGTIETSAWIGNTSERFSRDIGTFMGEWGNLYNNYSGAGFYNSGALGSWVKEVNGASTALQHHVHTDDERVGYYRPSSGNKTVACNN